MLQHHQLMADSIFILIYSHLCYLPTTWLSVYVVLQMFFNRLLASVSSLPNFTLHETCCVQNKCSVGPCVCSLLLKCFVFSSFYALLWVSLWLWHMSTCMAVPSTAITLNSEFLVSPVQKYIAVCRGDLFFDASEICFGSGSKKEIWKRDFSFCFGVIGYNEYREKNLLLFCICIQLLLVLRLCCSEFR